MSKLYLVRWEMVYMADNYVDAIAQAYAEICDIAKDPSQGANFVTAIDDSDHSIKTRIQIDEALTKQGKQLMKQTPTTINETGLQGCWSVTFIGDYATITTVVDALYDEAIMLAETMLKDYYGFNLSDWQTEIELI